MFKSNKFISKLEHKARKLGIRERVLLILLALVIVYMLWQNVVVSSLETSSKELKIEETQMKEETRILQRRYDNLAKEVDDQKVDGLASKISGLKSLNKELESEIVNLTKNLIPPDKMLTLLHDILTQDDTVKVVNLTNLPETEYFSTKVSSESGKEGEELDLKIYKHGIEIELEATFFGFMEFLYKLEQLKWNLIWDALTYEVADYPKGNAKLVVYTLSLSNNWIGL